LIKNPYFGSTSLFYRFLVEADSHLTFKAYSRANPLSIYCTVFDHLCKMNVQCMSAGTGLSTAQSFRRLELFKLCRRANRPSQNQIIKILDIIYTISWQIWSFWYTPHVLLTWINIISVYSG